jgi:hypothetical protein
VISDKPWWVMTLVSVGDDLCGLLNTMIVRLGLLNTMTFAELQHG